MQRTIEEIHKLILEKIKNAEIDLEKTRAAGVVYPNPEKEWHLCGEIDAYNDIEILIRTSHILGEENENNKNSD